MIRPGHGRFDGRGWQDEPYMGGWGMPGMQPTMMPDPMMGMGMGMGLTSMGLAGMQAGYTPGMAPGMLPGMTPHGYGSMPMLSVQQPLHISTPTSFRERAPRQPERRHQGGPARPPLPRSALPRLPQPHKPANDYCQHFVDTGARPQNSVRDSVMDDKFEDLPKQQELVALKEAQVRSYSTPPYALKADLRKLKLSKEVFGTKFDVIPIDPPWEEFDVILIDPPWEEYARRAPGLLPDAETWTWQEVCDLDVAAVADTPSFVFLWCGSAEGLDAGRHCLKRWGFQRREDICWIKTNKERASRKYLSPANQGAGSMLVHTKEHCLLGIRGALKRNLDGHIVHSNVDLDVIVSEEPPLGSTEKPEELYAIIERFANGRRRLELFGEDRNMRPGWVTVGRSISQTTFRKQAYTSHFRTATGVPYDEHRGGKPPPGAPVLVPSTAEIDELRPRSPPHSGRGRGR